MLNLKIGFIRCVDGAANRLAGSLNLGASLPASGSVLSTRFSLGLGVVSIRRGTRMGNGNAAQTQKGDGCILDGEIHLD